MIMALMALLRLTDELHIFYGLCVRSNKKSSSSVSRYKWHVDLSKYHDEI